MPGSHGPSIKRPDIYEALRRRGYDKSRAAAISNAAAAGTIDRKAAATGPFAVAPGGPGGLLSALARRRKEFDESKHPRDDEGKFGGGSGGGGEKKPAAKPKKKPGQEGKTKQEIANENRAAMAQQTGIGSNLDGAMARLNAGMGGQADEGNADKLVEQGLAKKDPTTGRYSLSPEGKKYYAAAAKGDADAARSAIGDAKNRVAGEAAKRAAADKKKADADKKKQDAAAKKKPKKEGAAEGASEGGKEEEKKPKGGGGGGGGKTEPRGGKPQKLLMAPESILAALRGQSQKAMRPGARRAWRHVYAEHKARGFTPAESRAAAGRALKAARAARAKRAYEQALAATEKAGRLMVFKDARGQDRWLAVSSTAYRDRDGEIVSSRALRGAVAVADVTGRRGPLRFWHVPGLDIGDCDYQATTKDGRFLIESGTFRHPAYARAVGAAQGWGMSIGFTHPASQPGPAGVFDDIAIFERSLVPPGRAANPFTRITTKETRRMDETKLKALVALLGSEAAQSLLGQVEQTAKAADAAGVAYKAASTPEEVTIGGVVYTLKAPPPGAPMDPAAATAPAVPMAEEPAEPEAEAPDIEELLSKKVGDLTGEELFALIAAASGTAAMEAMDGKIGDYATKMAEMKSQYEAMGKAFGAMQAQKDDERAQLKATVDQLNARLKELVGDMPAAGYRPSQVADSTISPSDPLAASVKARSEPGAVGPLGDVLRWAPDPLGLLGGNAAPSWVVQPDK